MGDRAVITASKSKDKGVGIYLHWYGDLPVVLALIDTAKRLGYRSPEYDETYGMARLCGLACVLSGIRSEVGIGIGELSQLDCNNYDNGTYVIGGNWELVDRWGSGSGAFDADAQRVARASAYYRDVIDEIAKQLDKVDQPQGV